jgi:hypothetical protein
MVKIRQVEGRSSAERACCTFFAYKQPRRWHAVKIRAFEPGCGLDSEFGERLGFGLELRDSGPCPLLTLISPF